MTALTQLEKVIHLNYNFTNISKVAIPEKVIPRKNLLQSILKNLQAVHLVLLLLVIN